MRLTSRWVWSVLIAAAASSPAFSQAMGGGAAGGGAAGGGAASGGLGGGLGGSSGSGGNSSTGLGGTPSISAPGSTGGGGTSSSTSQSNFLTPTFANPYYQGVLANQMSGNNNPGGFGTGLFGTTTGSSGGGQIGFAGTSTGTSGSTGMSRGGGGGGSRSSSGQSWVVNSPYSISPQFVFSQNQNDQLINAGMQSRLQGEIEGMLQRSKELTNAAAITVITEPFRDGHGNIRTVVTLRGVVPTADERKTIAGMVGLTDGVRAVKNEIRVVKP